MSRPVSNDRGFKRCARSQQQTDSGSALAAAGSQHRIATGQSGGYMHRGEQEQGRKGG